MADESRDKPKRKEIYTYEAPWHIYGMNWAVRTDHAERGFRVAIGSFIEEYNNKVEVIQLDDDTKTFVKRGTFDHPYPTTKIMWTPQEDAPKDLLATTGDYLRVWDLGSGGRIKMLCLLNNNKTSEYCAPLTAFDWNQTNPNIIGTSSIDTTCTIWDVETQQAKTQLIAHDKEVYDIVFAKNEHIFGSVGADGSVRIFDLRSLEHSTITYESKDLKPLLRLQWNKQDPNYMATFTANGTSCIILDIRVPSVPVAELRGHSHSVNAMAWAPHSSCHICTAGDDNMALIWDLSQMPKPIEDPILAYTADAEINQLQWSAAQPDWVAIAFDKRMQILRV